MKMLLLNQTGDLGGGELTLFTEVTNLHYDIVVLLFKDGPLQEMLKQAGVPVEVVAVSSGAIAVRKEFWPFGGGTGATLSY